MNRFYKTLVLLFLFKLSAAAQINISGGGINLGGGELTGSASTITTLHVSPFVNVHQSVISAFSLRLFLIYNRDLKCILPGTNSGRYFPYVMGGGLSVFEITPLSSALKLEYGAGVLMLSDHTYSDITNLGAGFTMNAALFLPLGPNDGNGWNLGGGAEYGQIFSTNNPGYFAYFLTLRYINI